MDAHRGTEPRSDSTAAADLPSIEQIRRRVISDLVDLDMPAARPGLRHRLSARRHRRRSTQAA